MRLKLILFSLLKIYTEYGYMLKTSAKCRGVNENKATQLLGNPSLQLLVFTDLDNWAGDRAVFADR
jgi:hypothetical protein